MVFAGVLLDVNNILYQEIEAPTINEEEVLVSVKYASICGSDIPRVKTKGTYHFPTIPGHEFAGIISAIGSSVKNISVGDRVSVYPLIPCKKCIYCQEDKENLCDSYNYLGSRCDGGFAQVVKCPARNVLKIPENVSLENASMVEPMAVALRGVKRGNITPGETVVVFGLGPIGLFSIQWAKLKGASIVIGIDRNEHKLDIAKNCGVTHTLNSSALDFDEKLKSLLDKLGADKVIECSGANIFQEKAIDIVKKFGTVSLLGNPKDKVVFKEKYFQLILRKEISLIGSWNSLITSKENEWQEVLDTLALGKIHTSSLITHRFSLVSIKQVFDDLHERKIKNYCKGIFCIE